jgi:phospholipid/cholesterol/gamma-HCH transport system substrate-binding protein
MDLHYQREITVGTLVLVGVGLFVAGTMWLKGSRFGGPERVALVEFHDIGTLKADNPVTVSGFQVGKVRSIDFQGPGKVVATLELDRSLKLKSDARAAIQSGFFSSDTRLLLNPGSDGAGPLADGAAIPGEIDEGLLGKGSSLADRADSVMIGVQAIANQKTADELTRTLKSLQRVLDNMDRHLPATSGEAQQTLASLRRLSDRLDSTIAELPVKNAIERADTLARNLSTMSVQLTATGAQLDTVLQRMNAGKGTLGKFASDTGLYLDSRQALQALKTLLDELNKHPGKLTIQVKLF